MFGHRVDFISNIKNISVRNLRIINLIKASSKTDFNRK